MRTAKKALALGLFSSGSPDTNASGEQAIFFIGDSNFVGQGEAAGPTPTAGTVKEFNGSTVVDVGAADMTTGLLGVSGAANVGSPLPKFGIDYNARTGKIPVLVSCARGGATFANNTGDAGNDFSSTGDNRADAEVKMAGALTALGTTKPAHIFVNLGINDFSGANTFATISTAIDSFHTWITGLYPGVKITYLQVGRSSAGIVTQKQSQIRNKLRALAEANTNTYILFAPVAMYDYGYYKVDLIHFNQTGNNFLGAALDDLHEAVDAGYDKLSAAVFCSFKDAVNTTKKDAINTFIAKYKNTNLTKCGTFQIYKGDSDDNCYLDWVGNLAPLFTSVTFSANTEIATSGATGSFIDSMWMIDEQIGDRVASDQDIVFGVRMGTKTTADGVLACLFGAVGSADNTTTSIFQTTTPSLQWRVTEDGGTSTILTTPPDTAFIAQSLYELARTGAATVSLKRDGVEIQAGTTAYEGTQNRTIKLGGRSNAAASVSNPIAAGYKCFYVATESGFDRTDWDADLDTLLAAL